MSESIISRHLDLPGPASRQYTVHKRARIKSERSSERASLDEERHVRSTTCRFAGAPTLEQRREAIAAA